MPTADLPESVRSLVRRVLASPSARSSPDLRSKAYAFVADLTTNEAPSAQPGPDAEPYLRKVALWAYKVLDREVEAMHAAGRSVDDVFEMTVAAAVSAGVTRMEIALAALAEVDDAPAA